MRAGGPTVPLLTRGRPPAPGGRTCPVGMDPGKTWGDDLRRFLPSGRNPGDCPMTTISRSKPRQPLALLAAILILSVPGGVRAEVEDRHRVPSLSPSWSCSASSSSSCDPTWPPEVSAANEAARRRIVGTELGRFLQNERAAKLMPTWLAYAKKNYDEGGASKWVTDRTVVLMALGPPGGIHRRGQGVGGAERRGGG